MQPALAAGIDVFTARSHESTHAYQGAGFGVSHESIDAYTREQVGNAYMNPDLLIILAMKDEIERSRRVNNRPESYEADRFESQDADFQQRIQDYYLEIARQKGIEPIDASTDRLVVQQKMRDQYMQLLFSRA